MGFIFGLIKRLLKLAIYLVLVIAIVTLIPNLPPYTKFTSIELQPALPRVGPLQENGVLNNAQRLYKDKLIGPEAFQLYNGEVYTTLGSGEVVKLSPGGHVTYVTKLGQPCQGLNQEPKCGRPLGFAIDEKNGKMYIADAYYGIWRVDIKTDKKQLLVSPRVEIEGRKPMLFNAVALAKNGDFYWTDSSSDFQLYKGVKVMLADPSGRLFHYNAATNKSKVLLDDLWFANGVAVSPDNQFVVVAETSRYRLVKYYVDGPKKGRSEVFLDGLPGTPDNVRALPDGSGLIVGLYVVFDEDTPMLAKSMSKTPIVRKFLARMITLAEMPFEFLNTHFPNAIFEKIAHSIANFKSLDVLLPPNSGLVVVDWNGNIIETYYNTDGSLKHISDAIVFQDKLYTGSPTTQDFIGAMPAPPLLKKAFAAVKATPPPKTAETVTKPIPKTESAEKSKEKKDVPKVKPVTETPKTTQPPKQEPVKTTPKPAEKNTEKTTPPPATKQMPKQTESTTPKPTSTTPKPSTTTQKPAKQPEEKKTTASPQTTARKAEKVEKPKSVDTKKSSPEPKQQKPVEKNAKPEQIPIREEIPSDTIKPTKENLKVIKKEGPTVIPNPEL